MIFDSVIRNGLVNYLALFKWIAGCLAFVGTLVMLAWGLKTQWFQGSDFRLRFYEAVNVRNGIDPFDLGGWTYPPWGYVFMEPFTLFPFEMAYTIFLASNIVFSIVIMVFTFRLCVKYCGNVESGLLGFGLALCSVNFKQMIAVENYGIYCCFGIVLMISSLNANKKVLAGVGWALLMLKPQLGIFVVIPMLIRREWKVIITAVSLCVLGTLIASVQVGKMPWVLLIETVKGNSCHFVDIDTYKLFSLLFYCGVPNEVTYSLSLLTVFGVVFFCSWRSRNIKDSYFALCPAVVSSMFISYVSPHDWVMLFVMIILAVYLLQVLATKRAFPVFIGIVLLVIWPRYFRFLNEFGISIHNLIRYVGFIIVLLLFYSSSTQMTRAKDL